MGLNNTGGTINNSYVSGNVTGTSSSQDVGGLLGYSTAGGVISNSYANGTVTVGSSSTFYGGLIGYYASGTVSNLFWNTQTTGQSNGSGNGIVVGTGLTVAQMKNQANFGAWDFTGTWRMYEGNTNPLLRSYLSPVSITANNAVKTYDGTAYSGSPGVIYSDPAAAPLLLGTLSYTSSGANAGLVL